MSKITAGRRLACASGPVDVYRARCDHGNALVFAIQRFSAAPWLDFAPALANKKGAQSAPFAYSLPPAATDAGELHNGGRRPLLVHGRGRLVLGALGCFLHGQLHLLEGAHLDLADALP